MLLSSIYEQPLAVYFDVLLRNKGVVYVSVHVQREDSATSAWRNIIDENLR